MAYTILNPDGTTLLLLADGNVDQSTTSIALVGRNVNSYGQYLNNNLVAILANSANTAGSPPRSPLTGQLWYDTTARRLKVYDSGFKTVSGALVSSARPGNLSAGDLWFDSTNNQLKIYSGSIMYTVGPLFPKSAGETGWVLPQTGIKDASFNVQQTTLLRNYGITLGAISAVPFTVDATDSATYLNNIPNIVAGLTILGDIKYTGQITNNYLSMNINIDKIAPAAGDVTNKTYVDQTQNPAIISWLIKMFPPSGSSFINLVDEPGVPLGTQARVLCEYNYPTPGYQVRRFIVDRTATGIPTWDIYITTSTVSTAAVANLVY